MTSALPAVLSTELRDGAALHVPREHTAAELALPTSLPFIRLTPSIVFACLLCVCLITGTLSAWFNSSNATESTESSRIGSAAAFLSSPIFSSSFTPPGMSSHSPNGMRPPVFEVSRQPPRRRTVMRESNDAHPYRLPQLFHEGLRHITEFLELWRAAEKEEPESSRLISGDAMLLNHIRGVNRDLERQMLNDPSSFLARLTELFATRKAAKVVIMGYAGSGKTETVKLAMARQRRPVTHLNFDLRSWYLRKTDRKYKKIYSKGDEHKKAQLALLKDPAVQFEIVQSCKQEIAVAMKTLRTNTIVAFIDEIDLVGAEVLPENIEAMEIWLGLVAEAVGESPVIQVAVLHPGVVARDPGIGQAVEAHGFNITEAIDFSVGYSEISQVAMVNAFLTPRCMNLHDARGMTLADYFHGAPGAYKRLLLNEGGDLSKVHSALRAGDLELALELAKQSGRQGIMDQITHDMLFDTTRAQKNAISFLQAQWPSQDVSGQIYPYCDFPGAARVGSLIKTADGRYMMSPVYHDALSSVLQGSVTGNK